MSKKIIFRGVATALVTPFRRGEIDYSALRALIDRQIDAGIEALVIGGTTGEAATLTNKERYSLYDKSAEYVSGRAKLIFGTGTNDTSAAIQHTEYASEVGGDGVLIVTPYYNKGTKEGLLRHYEKIAAASTLPVLLYNVPTRTGVNLPMDILKKLSKNENIVGIKEASDSADRLVELSRLGDSLYLYSGNDSQIYTTLSLGGLGVISVVSNLYPEKTAEICKQFFANNHESALDEQKKLLPVINSLFLETNPAPIKYALAKRGLCSSEMRLPMWLPTSGTRRKIDRILSEYEAQA